jgi:predicted amidophosphoribosyltransferase
MNHKQFAAHEFTTLEDAPFNPEAYSRLKFGCDHSARAFARNLAHKFFNAHAPELLSNRCVIIPSPYNYVKNAATILTEYFIKYLNHLIVNVNGEPVEFDMIKRYISYTSDYGFMSKDQRKSLLNGDTFYLNSGFYEDKTLIFLDDVVISGAHEEKLKEILAANNIKNNCFFIYYAKYLGQDPSIESRLNFAAVNSLSDYVKMTSDPRHHVIVRPLKYLLSREPEELRQYIVSMDGIKIEEIYHGCIGEGYHKIPGYQENFQTIAKYCSQH